MRYYSLLDMLLVGGILLALVFFYPEYSQGYISTGFIISLFAVTLVYFIGLHVLNAIFKSIFRNVARKMRCDYQDTGKFSLSIYMICKDMDIHVTLRSAYMPDSLHLTIKGKFIEAFFDGKDKASRTLTNNLLNLGKRYRIRVNDAILSKEKAQFLFTRIPMKEESLLGLINEVRLLASHFME